MNKEAEKLRQGQPPKVSRRTPREAAQSILNHGMELSADLNKYLGAAGRRSCLSTSQTARTAEQRFPQVDGTTAFRYGRKGQLLACTWEAW